MSADRFIAEHVQEWDALEARLTAPPANGADSAALIEAYRTTSSHLSVLRGSSADPLVIERLTQLVGRAHGVIHGRQARQRRVVSRFFTVTFPGAVWWHRRFIFVSALLFFVPAVTVGAWMAVSEDAVEASAPDSVREAYLESDFEDYYSSDPAAQFATEVFINNIQVAILAFAVGILLCVPTMWVLVQNGALIGLAAGLFTAAGRWEQFWGLITPHGLLEVSAIIVAGAAGLALGWSWIAPGDQRRSASLAAAGLRSITVVIGLVLAFLVAGMIEGFVTGSDLPTAARVGIGIAAFAAFAGWIVALGPSAERNLDTQTGAGGPIVGRRSGR